MKSGEKGLHAYNECSARQQFRNPRISKWDNIETQHIGEMTAILPGSTLSN